MLQLRTVSSGKDIDLKVLASLVVCVLSLVFVPLQVVHSLQGFQLNVNLWNGAIDSGKVKVYVYAHDSEKGKSKNINVGKIVSKRGDTTIEDIVFRFTDKQLPPNGGFSACVYSKSNDKTQCEQADRHHNVKSAVVWVQIPN